LSRWKNMRTAYVKAKAKISKWDKAPSGSAPRNTRRPRLYKYHAEMSFLDEVLLSEATTDNLSTQPPSTPTASVGDLSDISDNESIIAVTFSFLHYSNVTIRDANPHSLTKSTLYRPYVPATQPLLHPQSNELIYLGVDVADPFHDPVHVYLANYQKHH
jgi:hypothetical protein